MPYITVIIFWKGSDGFLKFFQPNLKGLPAEIGSFFAKNNLNVLMLSFFKKQLACV